MRLDRKRGTGVRTLPFQKIDMSKSRQNLRNLLLVYHFLLRINIHQWLSTCFFDPSGRETPALDIPNVILLTLFKLFSSSFASEKDDCKHPNSCIERKIGSFALSKILFVQNVLKKIQSSSGCRQY